MSQGPTSKGANNRTSISGHNPSQKHPSWELFSLLQECLLIAATQAGVGKNGRWRLYQECVGVEGEEVVGK